MWRAMIILWCTLAGTAAMAQSFERCEKTEIEPITMSIDGALTLAEAAAAAVGDNETYAEWFGRYSPRNAERVRSGMKAVHSALVTREISIYCGNNGEGGCKDGTYAYVYPDEHYHVTLCPPFFSLPHMFAEEQDSRHMENGTREGTIIHEISHFVIVANTDDICYSRSVCSELALDDPNSVTRNADSFQYFAEDVAFLPLAVVTIHPTGRARF